jgi:hypothetical protein
VRPGQRIVLRSFFCMIWFMRVRGRVTATLMLFLCSGAQAAEGMRPRVVISSDFPPVDVIPGALGSGPAEKRSDPDDVQSMVRFLVYANEFRLEALVASAGTVANIARKQHILDVLDRYEQVEASLRLHDDNYPTAAYLRSRTVEGAGSSYGKPADQILGEGRDSEASRFIIDLLQRADPDPVWFCFWGGSQELGQALWRLRKERTPEQVAELVRRIRVYFIAPQDGSARWIMDTFPEMFVIFSQKAFTGMHYNAAGSVPATGDLAWLSRFVREDHGPLGEAYPRSGWNHRHEGVIEGDSPSFLYLFSGTRGLSDLNHPAMGGWGGRFQQSGTSPTHWVDSPEGPAAVSRWHDARQRDFAARMDRCVHPPGFVNRPPHAVLNGEDGYDVLRVDVRPGQRIRLDATRSSDPDGHALTWRWWVYREPGTYSGSTSITGSESKKATLVVPPDAAGKSIHIVLEITDSGSPSLTSYRRMVLNVRAGG